MSDTLYKIQAGRVSRGIIPVAGLPMPVSRRYGYRQAVAMQGIQDQE